MILLKSDADTEVGISPSASALAAMTRRNAEGVASGVLLVGEYFFQVVDSVNSDSTSSSSKQQRNRSSAKESPCK